MLIMSPTSIVVEQNRLSLSVNFFNIEGPATRDNLDMAKVVCKLCGKGYANKGAHPFKSKSDSDTVFYCINLRYSVHL
jgi:hypothetical protein